MKITIPGNPIPKARHKLTTHGGYARMYDPQEKEKRKLKSDLARALHDSNSIKDLKNDLKPSNLTADEFYYLDVSFYVCIPDSAPEAKKNAMLWGLIRPNKKPDLDNLLKFLCDCANEILFPDDRMIVSSSQEKWYSDKPRTEIQIMSKKEPPQESPTVKILRIMGPHEILAMLKITSFLNALLNSTTRFNAEDCDRVTALLSKLADLYSDKLKRISRACPEYWVEKLPIEEE